MEGCDLVVTGEGFLDEQSFDGKVVGGVVALAAALWVPVLVVAGDVMDPLPQAVEAVSLTERFGGERSRLDTAGLHRGGRRRPPGVVLALPIRWTAGEEDDDGHDADHDQQLGQA